MSKRLPIIYKIYNALVVDQAEKTPAQLAKMAKTTESTVRKSISNIRKLGYAIYANVKVDKRGAEKVVYRCGNPTNYMIKTGSTMTR